MRGSSGGRVGLAAAGSFSNIYLWILHRLARTMSIRKPVLQMDPTDALLQSALTLKQVSEHKAAAAAPAAATGAAPVSAAAPASETATACSAAADPAAAAAASDPAFSGLGSDV
jgi:hypothetical protein